MNIRGRTLLVVAGVLMFGLSACSYMEYQGVSGSKAQPVSYSEKDGRIDLDSICANERNHAKDFYSCSANADAWLEQQCNSYRGLYTSSDQTTAQRYRHEYHKFCDAAAAWEKPERNT